MFIPLHEPHFAPIKPHRKLRAHLNSTFQKMPSLIAALRLRALIKEVFAEPALLKTAPSGEVVAILEEIAETNPYYARTFLGEYVDWLEANPEDEEGDESEEDRSGEKRNKSDEAVAALGELTLTNADGDEKDGTGSPEDLEDGLTKTDQKHTNSITLTSTKHILKTDPYELLCSLLSAKPLTPTTPDLLQYPIDSSTWVSIRETPRVISGQGTTGARTWNAALLLALLLNTESRFEDSFKGSTVLELGAGTGLVSAALAKKWSKHSPKKIMISDGDAGVVEKLPLTVELNGVEPHDIECVQYLWGETQLDEKVDIVLGADIVYDPSVLGILLDTLGGLFHAGAQYAIISRSDRNPETTRQWEQQCDDRFEREVIRVEDPVTSKLPCWFHSGANNITVEIIRARR